MATQLRYARNQLNKLKEDLNNDIRSKKVLFADYVDGKTKVKGKLMNDKELTEYAEKHGYDTVYIDDIS